MRLKVGDKVVYSAYGIGHVVARERRLVNGSDSEVVVVELSDLTVSLPIERANAQLRSLASEADLRQVEAVLRDECEANTAPWLSRERESRAKLANGNPVGLAEIVRDGTARLESLILKGARPQLADGERHLFAKARQLLANEIAHVRGLATIDADAWIGRQLAHTV